jgi:hypothetical protein
MPETSEVAHLGHLKKHAPSYVLLALAGLTGGTAVLTDNLPVTNKMFHDHEIGTGVHPAAEQKISEIQGTLQDIRVELITQSLRQAYTDKCAATDPRELRYIQQEIDSLARKFQGLTGFPYQAPPCL